MQTIKDWAPLVPALLMLLTLLLMAWPAAPARPWRVLVPLSALALASSLLLLGSGLTLHAAPSSSWLALTPLGSLLGALVQLLGTVIAVFSSRYLQGEAGQRRYVAALAGVLAAVQVLLLANHWLVLIVAWALVGVALEPLLCFYPERPFARLAAHKKWLADRLADALLLAAAFLAWRETGSGSLAELSAHLAAQGADTTLQMSALCLALAVVLRTALLPVHGWLIQVMEAPTPVSALLHAGVVNLGGFVLIRLADLLAQAPVARWLLVLTGLGTAVLAGLVMLTRISIKVRLAWSTVAQMGFMVLECGLGLYTLAALHLIGHSLYKAHSFLAASSVVRQTRLQALQPGAAVQPASLLLAPLAAGAVLALPQWAGVPSAWPAWWTALLALAWAPLLWLPRTGTLDQALRRLLAGLAMVAGLGTAAWLAHTVPLGLQDAPATSAGTVALLGMALLYLCLALLQWRPQALETARRWSYAGFYLDEYATRLALLWPARWMVAPSPAGGDRAPALAHAHLPLNPGA